MPARPVFALPPAAKRGELLRCGHLSPIGAASPWLPLPCAPQFFCAAACVSRLKRKFWPTISVIDLSLKKACGSVKPVQTLKMDYLDYVEREAKENMAFHLANLDALKKEAESTLNFLFLILSGASAYTVQLFTENNSFGAIKGYEYAKDDCV
jgi:hypothetical protein